MLTEKISRKFRFTKKAIEALPPHPKDSPSTNQEYSSEECTGLRLLVSKSKKLSFHARFRINSRKRIVKICDYYPGIDLDSVRAQVHELRAMVARGTDPLAEKMKKRKIPTFTSFTEEHYLPWSKENKRSYRQDCYAVEQLKPVFGKLQLSAIRTKDIRQFLEKKKQASTGSTANRIKSIMSSIFRIAIEREIVSENPCLKIKPYKESSGKERFLSNEELKRFLKVLDSYGDRVVAYYIKYLLFTGQRKGEAEKIAWKDVDFEKNTVHLHQEQTKNGKSRYVQLNSMALGVLENLKAMGNKGPWVFPGNVKGHHLVNHNKFFIEVKEEAGIENLRTHDLRHSFASLALAAGCTLFDVQNLLGHSDPSQSMRYSHLSADAIKQASEGVATVISNAIE